MMPPFIPFTWTTPALLAGQKIMIRRDGIEGDFVGFLSGQFVWAYDYPPRCGGSPVAALHLLDDPNVESTLELSDHDYVDEGFAFLEQFPFLIPESIHPLRKLFRIYQSVDYSLWVLRFEVVELTPEGRRMAERLFRRIYSNSSYTQLFI